MIRRLEAEGGHGGKEWDDGADYENVTKIYVRTGLERGQFDGIQYIYFDYIKNGQPNNGPYHGRKGEGFTEETFVINHLKNEYLESVEGYYKTESLAVQALQFKTNFRNSEIFGYHNNGNKFTLAVQRMKIIGFHGSASGRNLNSLGAYFTWITPTKLEAKGGKEGKEWDDGFDHEGVAKIHVRGCRDGIQVIKFDYVKNGQLEGGPVHGILGEGFTQLFEINHDDNEYLVYVEGYYDETSRVIQGLRFKTNIKISELMGYEKGKKFSLSAYGKKIIGFHGYAEKNLNTLGAYFTTLPPIKLERVGGSIRFEYDNGGKVEMRQHGYIGGHEEEFVVDYPNEYITSVEGTFVHDTDTWVKSLIFKTSKGRTSQTFGNESADNSRSDFVLENKGCALVGFHGRSTKSGTFPDTVLIGLGAYFDRLPPPPPLNAEKLEAQGDDGGFFWDDGGNFDGIMKIYVGHAEIGVTFLKFLYIKDAQLVVGNDHGSKTLLGVEEFEMEYPSEYLTSVEGSYGKVDGSESKDLTMLKFKTNKRTSKAFGLDMISNFVLHKEGNKIVGFHGKANNMLHQIGVHVLPITN
ncbi:unnamed protein product [Arabidopsis thaliana]|uniref:Jacalin-type lectin domain-containing protein n=1 Tax=Arabidopsis thaliana TaxID=3702 RepID=A0A654ETF8_ARATH|nr:unnamed protein product [Arabidopsis thaliana]